MLNLMLLSAVLLEGTVQCVLRLARWRQANPRADGEQGQDRAVGGLLTGLARVARSPVLRGISVYVLLLAITNTFLYFEQGRVVRALAVSREETTAIFAKLDLLVNVVSLLTQMFLTARLLKWLGLTFGIALLPVLSALGFGLFALSPTFLVFAGFQALRRALQYGIERPSRELLFTTVPREDKYKSRNFIDTVLFRGGDAFGGWLYDGLLAVGLGLSGVSGVAVLLSLVWLALGLFLGRRDARQEAVAAAAAGAEGAASHLMTRENKP
jgi:AAA family ATP:ADP antiporter